MDPDPSPDVPLSMMTLDMWLPPSQEVDTWGLLDVGQLGPAPRFGLLSPVRDHQPAITHWKYLKSLQSLPDNVLFSKPPQFKPLLKYWGHLKNFYSNSTNYGVDGKNLPSTPQIVVSIAKILL